MTQEEYNKEMSALLRKLDIAMYNLSKTKLGSVEYFKFGNEANLILRQQEDMKKANPGFADKTVKKLIDKEKKESPQPKKRKTPTKKKK